MLDNNRKLIEVAHKFKILGHPNRLKILLLCSQKEKTITEISKFLKISLTRTSEHISNMERIGLVKKTRHKDNTVTVKSLVEINEKGEIKVKG